MDLIKKENEMLELSVDKKYLPMVKSIQEYMPVVHADTQHFLKTQSQFMDNMLTVSHPTPLRNIRQMLAEINKAKSALAESHFANQKKRIEIKKLQRKLEIEEDELERQLIQVEIDEKQTQVVTTEGYQQAAVRKIANYIEQIKSIKESIGIESITEADFEKEEEKYHIMKAFEQAICAARAHGGVIDEGNHIYLSQLGINGALAQTYVTKLFVGEQQVIEAGKVPSANFVSDFLIEMATAFAGCSKHVLERKNMTEDSKTVLGE